VRKPNTIPASDLAKVQELKDFIREVEIELTQNPSEQLAEDLTKVLCSTSSSIYYSEALESFYIDLAHKNSTDTHAHVVERNSILHVMTMCYTSGGHTRVVERWIQSAPKQESHSVVLLDQCLTEEIPPLLRQVTKEKQGQLITFSQNQSITHKANKLREIAQRYEYIILHHHMHDPVPLMAFGLPGFNRPVITFNHAGHMFWLGRNATDLAIDIEDSQNIITTKQRGIANSTICPLPYIENNNFNTPHNKESLRHELGLPINSPILASMAQAYKYAEVLGYSFSDVIRQILNRTPQTVVVLIGLSSECDDWKQLCKDYPQRLYLLGTLPHATAIKYLRACDLYIDSFPYISFTSLIDAIAIGGLPALSLQTPVGSLPLIKGTAALIESQSQLVETTINLLKSEPKRIKLQKTQKESLKSLSHKKFQESIQDVYAKAATIKKNSSRYLNIEDQITKFDILSNLITSKQHNIGIQKRQHKLLGGIITKEKTILGPFTIKKSKKILGFYFYKWEFPNPK